MNKIQFTYIYNLKWNLGTVPEKRLSQPRVEIVVVVRGSGSRTIFTENLENHCLLENGKKKSDLLFYLLALSPCEEADDTYWKANAGETVLNSLSLGKSPLSSLSTVR